MHHPSNGVVCGLALLPSLVFALAPFGTGYKVPVRQVKTVKVVPTETEFLSGDNATRWSVELPPDGSAGPAFSIDSEEGIPVLRIATDLCQPARTTVRLPLPGDGPANGNVWSKNNAGYVTFLCRSTQPARMTFHLLHRGKSAGTYNTGFAAETGDWRRVVLPVASFKLRNFANTAGLGVRVAAAAKGTVVSIRDIAIDGTPFNDLSWASHQVKISLDGTWRFATDPGEEGSRDQWFADAFDDSAWRTIQSGQGWQRQGIDHYGWGWYRQRLVLPEGCEGMPLTLDLGEIPSDDDVWFNGVRIGGIGGEYKYKNMLRRRYAVPASLIRHGAENTLAIRVWGGDITFIGANSGLAGNLLTAEFDPYQTILREPGGQAVPYRLFDLGDAQRGKPFEILFPFPAEVAPAEGVRFLYRLSDILGNVFASGDLPLEPARDGVVSAVVPVDRATSQAFYLRGRVMATLTLVDAAGRPIYLGERALDQVNFSKRDDTPLPALREVVEDTPYGRLTLVDEIDCATPVADEPHPYLESAFDHAASHCTPGVAAQIQVSDILGRKGRESLGMGWFAYRIGRGSLRPHTTYLLRIEYPEDKPRFAPIEIQTGQNYMDVGWRNGTGPDGVYDNWPLSGRWQWYDVIVPLDDQTVGTGGTGSASATNGFWVYFMNKIKPDMYYALWPAGPAVGRMKLYAIDSEANAPVIRTPAGLPHRVLSLDWERQPDHDPADLVRYAKLMGYNAISPVILKWFFANYGEPLNGYDSMCIDARDYWAHRTYDPASGEDARSPYPGRKSQHLRYLEATQRYGIDYIPRIEWGGSKDLPVEARAIETTGEPAKPNRFAPWCANLLNPLTWDDLQRFMDHLVKPYVNDHPQLTGVLWRIRCDRMRISYGKADLELFARETATALPPGREAQWAAWATGEGRALYDAWWHGKRAAFHARFADLLRSYRADLTLYYYNWDGDKFGLILPANTTWAFNKQLMAPGPGGARSVYERDEAERRSLTAADYIEVLRSGNFGPVNRADYAIRPSLYKDLPGIQLFAPANYLCYADNAAYLDYFQTGAGLAVANAVPYDEIGSRAINPKYEGNMITPAGAAFSMALELLPYFHGDARTLNYTVYTYGRGFADAHRRFAQAFLALPAIPGTIVDQGDADLKVRRYPSPNGTYVGVAYKGYAAKTLAVTLPATKGSEVIDLVSGSPVKSEPTGDGIRIAIPSGPMELHAFLLR